MTNGSATRSELPYFEPLSHLDASFLALESSNTHMHVAAVVLFEAHQLKLADGGIDIARIKAHIFGKLQYIPRYRQRLAFVPGTRHPVWIDDDHFNFDYHVRHTSLPRPGAYEQLKLLAGRIVSQQLDRAKPLWELWVVEGLDNNLSGSIGRFAIIAKIHHCMIDGVSGIDLAGILLNVDPTTTVERPDEWTPRPAPSGPQLLVAEAARASRRTVDTMSSLRSMGSRSRALALATGGRTLAAMSSLRSGWLSTASRTPLNPDLGPNRRFDWVESSLEDVKEIRRALDVSVNDVLLAVVAGALRRFLEGERGFEVGNLEFRAMVPVSTRRADQRGALGNQVAMWLVNLPLSENEPLQRLQKVRKETTRLKRTNQALGAATLVELSRGTPLTVIAMANRVVGRMMRPFNLTVTNVPGPQFPMYLLEAKMIASYPIVPLWSQHGLGLAIFSYDGHLHWGIHADFDAIPDTDRIAAAITAEIAELLAATRKP